MIVHGPQDEVAPEVAEGLRRLTGLAWPGADERHDPALDPELFALTEGGSVVAGLGVLRKRIRHAGRPWHVAGLSAVVVDPAQRRRGHAARLASAAREWILAGPADLAVFTCDRPLAAVYERSGFAPLPGAVLVGGTVEEPFPSDSGGMDKVVLAAWRTADDALIRPLFTGARIALHPGRMDRLW